MDNVNETDKPTTSGKGPGQAISSFWGKVFVSKAAEKRTQILITLGFIIFPVVGLIFAFKVIVLSDTDDRGSNAGTNNGGERKSIRQFIAEEQKKSLTTPN